MSLPKKNLIANLTKIGSKLCAYLHESWPCRCDCKFGEPSDKPSNRSERFPGCPEVAQAISILSTLTPTEWKRVEKRLNSKTKRVKKS